MTAKDLVKSASDKLESISASGSVMMVLASARSDLYAALALLESEAKEDANDE